MKNGFKARLLSRRNFFGFLGAGAGGVAYMHFGEPGWLEVNQPRVNLVGGAAPGAEIRVLHLSDFHASPVVDLKFIEHAVELGASLKPDVVCLTGDFITSTYDAFGEYGRIFRKLSAVAPTFACMGNHDGGAWVRRWGYADWKLVGEMLSGAGVTLLDNRAERVDVNGKRLQLVGVGDLWAKELDAEKAFRETEKGMPTILLSHNPDSKSVVADFNWNLMLSGHTHGGQCWIPFWARRLRRWWIKDMWLG